MSKRPSGNALHRNCLHHIGTVSLLNPPILAGILGPTNTGKTHYAVERMLARTTGVIGLPLRLLAREVYDKVVAQKGAGQVALITGEEKIVPKHARYFICTVEAMPTEREFAFVAIDEVQLMEHPERGHIFTDRALHMRGTEETLLLGAETTRSLLHHLLGREIRFDTRQRFSELSYAGPMRLTRLPKRSVIVAFSASEVYAIAELIRRYRGGAAVVMGRLSPRTRNAQADLYQSGEVDFLVATDAVGMGLNLDADHVAFASLRKFDGHRKRYLSHMEAGQIAGRAGRFRRHGTFGTTADAPEMDEQMVQAIVEHHFEPIGRAEWRNSDLDFSTLEALRESLYVKPPSRRLHRVRPATDELSLERLATLPEVIGELNGPSDVKRLWDLCQVPDFRDLTIDAHVRMLTELHDQMQAYRGKLPHDFMERRVGRLDDDPDTLERMGVDVLQQRLAQIRTWTYCANKVDWMFDAGHWQNRTRAVEDRLSDALHQSLIARFVDRRTSALLKGIGANTDMTATIKDSGEVWVDDHKIGHLEGLSFTLDTSGSELEEKALQAAAAKAIGPEIDRRLTSMSSAMHSVFTLSDTGEILWGGKPVGRIAKSGTVFTPAAEVIGGEYGNPNLVNMAEERLRQYLAAEVQEKLAPLFALRELSNNPEAKAETRGFAYQLLEEFGSLPRERHARTIRELDRDARSEMWTVGTVFGQYDIFLRDMVKPKPARLLSLLVSFGAGGDRKPYIPFAGMTSIPDPDGEIAKSHSTQAIRLAGYRVAGPRIVRFDILERLSRMIRQAQGQDRSKGPQAFQIMQEMLALLGSTYEEVRDVLTALGYKHEEREVPEPEAAQPEAPETPAQTDTVPGPVPGPPSEGPAVEDTDDKADDKAEAIPEQTSTDTAAEAIPATTEAPAPKKRRKGSPHETLHVFHVREPQEDGTTKELPNTEFWVWGRVPHNQRRGGQRGGKGGRPPGRGPHQDRGRGKGKGKPPKGFKPDRNKTPREPRRVEDSPFAALKDLYKKD